MSFSKTLLAGLVAVAIATPVFADDAANTSTMSNSTTAQATAPATQVNLNTANARDLMKVKGITSTKARAIVAYRKKHGNFNSVDDLSKVSGFTRLKSSKLKAITDQLTVS